MNVIVLSKAGLLNRVSLFFLFTFLLSLLVACKPFDDVVPMVLQGKTMGTTYNITIANPAENLSENELQQGVDQLLLNVNQQMSTYIDDSEISQFNKLAINRWQTVSTDFIEVALLSQQLSTLSGGRFDVTIGPLIELWGFGRESSSSVPSDEAITEAKAKVGWQALDIDVDKQQLRKTKPISVNLSAIAKGFGVDKIAGYLETNGVENYLVEIGGEIRVKGLSPSDQSWRLGIEKPSLSQQGAQEIVALSDASIATSGDYRNYFEENGLRYSHTIDPQTGKPVRHNIASVTVIALTAALADGYATALNVMGLDDALSLAKEQQLAAFFILYDQNQEGGYREVMTSQFDQYLAHEREEDL